MRGTQTRGGGDTSGSAVRGSSHPPPHLPPPGTAAEPRVPPGAPPVLTCTMVRGLTDSVGKLPRPWMGTVSPRIWSSRCTCSHVSTLKRSPVRCSEQPAASAASIAPPAAPPGSGAENSRKYRAGGCGGGGGKKKKRGGKKTTKPVPSGGSCGRRRTPGGAAGNRSAPQHSRPPPAELSTALARAPPPGYIGAPAAPPLARPRRQSLPGLTDPPAL